MLELIKKHPLKNGFELSKPLIQHFMQMVFVFCYKMTNLRSQ